MNRIRCVSPLIVLLAALTLTSPHPVLAAEGDEDAQILALFREGNIHFRAGRNAEAELVLEKAWSIRKTHDVAGNLALAELNQGKALEALEHLQFALEHMPAGAAKKRHVSIDGAYTKALAAVGVLKIVTEPQGATVTVNGPLTVKVAEGLAVAPGERVVRASLPGFAPLEQRIAVKAGSTQEVKLTLAREPVAAAGQVSQTPPAAAASATSTPAPTESSAPTAEHPSTTSVLVVGGAVTVVGVAAGTVLAILANGSAADANDAVTALGEPGAVHPCQAAPAKCQEVANARTEADNLGNLSVVAFGAAGAAAVGTGLLYWLWSSDAEQAPAVQVGASPQAASVVFQGKF